PGGRALVERAGGWLTVSLDGRPVLRSDCSGRFRYLRFGAEAIHLELPAGTGTVELPGVAHGAVRAAFLGDAALALEPQDSGIRVRVERRMAGAAVDILLAPASTSG